MRRTVVAYFLWLITTCGGAFGQTGVYVPVATLRHWALAYREFSTEFMDCVYGKRGDTIRVAFTVPADVRPSRSTPDDVTPTTECAKGDIYLGDAHSHPKETATINGQRFHIDPNVDECYLSKPDRDSFLADSLAQITIVVCGFGQFMVWTKGDTLTKPGYRCIYDPEYPTDCGERPSLHKASQ